MKTLGKEELIQVQKILENLLPTSLQIVNVVALTIAEDGIDRTVFANDNFDQDNLAVVAFDYIEAPERLNITMFSLEASLKELENLLKETLDWNQELEFAGLNEEQIKIVKGLCDQRSDGWIYTHTHVYGLWPETSLDPVAPSTPVSFSSLDQSYAPLLNSYWKFRDGQTEAMIAGLARLGKVFGLFAPQEDKPVAWMLMYSQGSLGMLRTSEEYRNKGFGSFLVQNVTQEANKQLVHPYVHIEDDNQLSQDFFTRLGFIKRDSAVWVNHYPCESKEKKLHV